MPAPVKPAGNTAKVFLLAQPYTGVPAKPVEWVIIKGDRFNMGVDYYLDSLTDARPKHEVNIQTFEMSKTEVTVEQYAECVIKGVCTEPLAKGQKDFTDYCNWEIPGREQHPVNCVDWRQAVTYAEFKGGRLPTESEWEYTASGFNRYPWGIDDPTCEQAVMKDGSGSGCGKRSTWPVCSKPAGNNYKGLCDMAGNVAEWVQDKYYINRNATYNTYRDAPPDGRAYTGGPNVLKGSRVVRGGSFKDEHPVNTMMTYHREYYDEDFNRTGSIGFRIARSIR